MISGRVIAPLSLCCRDVNTSVPRPGDASHPLSNEHHWRNSNGANLQPRRRNPGLLDVTRVECRAALVAESQTRTEACDGLAASRSAAIGASSTGSCPGWRTRSPVSRREMNPRGLRTTVRRQSSSAHSQTKAIFSALQNDRTRRSLAFCLSIRGRDGSADQRVVSPEGIDPNPPAANGVKPPPGQGFEAQAAGARRSSRG